MTNSHNVTLPNTAPGDRREGRRCQACHCLLPVATRGRLPRYCSDACKQAAYRNRAEGRKANYFEIMAGVKTLSVAECERLIDALYNRMNEVGNDHS